MPQYRIYKARVTSVTENEQGKLQIYVTPLEPIGDTAVEKPANPPSNMPTSMVGSGILSMPDVGQLCLVAESDSEYKVNILNYVIPDGFNPYGSLSAEQMSPGSYAIKIGGLNKSLFSMDRSGRMELFSNNFARFKVDGSRKAISMTSKSTTIEFAGGSYSTNYYKEDTDTNLKDLVEHKQIYSKFTENPGFSDREHFETEVPVKPVSVNRYVDKAIVRAGLIRNMSNSSELMNHVYQIETRQNTFGNVIDKDTVTALRLGYQKEHQKYGVSDTYPGGTLIDWTAKRNHPTDFVSYVFRVGKYEGDVAGSQATQGEILRTQVHADKLDRVPYGAPQLNPVGDGKGYNFEWGNSNMGQQYLISFGSLSSSRAPQVIKGSFYRFHTHRWNLAGNGLEQSEVLGSDEAMYFKQFKRSGPSVVSYTRTWDDESFRRELTWEQSKSTFAFDKDKWDLNHETSDATSSVTAGKDGINAILSKNGEYGIQIKESEIIIKTKKMTLQLSDDGGLKLNGTPLVYANFVEFFNKYTSNLGMGNMGSPVPLFPAAQAEHDTKYKQTFDNAKGFKTGK